MSGVAALSLWSHALAALLFGGLAAVSLREPGAALPRASIVAALAASALWALAVAGIGGGDVAARVTESVRNVAWLFVLYAVLRQEQRTIGSALAATFVAVAAVCTATAVVAVAQAALDLTGVGPTRLMLRMIAVVGGLVLVHHAIVAAAPASRGGVRLALLALAMLWSAEMIVFVTAWSGLAGAEPLVVARGVAAVACAMLLALAIHRGGNWTLSPSRTLASRALAAGAVAAYAVVVIAAISLLAAVGGTHVRAVQTAIVAGATATLIALLASPWLRAWLKVKVAKHVFHHRYDYRREWLRFTATLGRADASAAPLEPRLVKALADLTDSPGGLLLVATDDGLEPAGHWNWTGPEGACPHAFATTLEASDRILDLAAAPDVVLPAWLVAHPDAWIVVPLIHRDRLAGAVVLARPPVARALDWEDFDLLRVAGRQGASHLAESRAAAALAEAQRFDEFNRRFAFIVHDVKNLMSQLTLVARNAERHADNPAFRADMIATLKDSCGRMAALLERLSQHGGHRADPPRPTDLAALAGRIARTRFAPYRVEVGGAGLALVDPLRAEQVLAHLIQNAVEASVAGTPVVVAVADATLTVTDRGCGMTPGFVRDELFRPFASSKDGGFGIGAFEARQLTQAMGGTIAVDSRPSEGSRFTLTFPPAPALEVAA